MNSPWRLTSATVVIVATSPDVVGITSGIRKHIEPSRYHSASLKSCTEYHKCHLDADFASGSATTACHRAPEHDHTRRQL